MTRIMNPQKKASLHNLAKNRLIRLQLCRDSKVLRSVGTGPTHGERSDVHSQRGN